jgi:hypothetical protein
LESIQRTGNVIGNRPFYLTNEAQSEMQLLITDPAKGRAVVHGVDQQIANLFWRPEGHEKPVHPQDLGLHIGDV